MIHVAGKELNMFLIILTICVLSAALLFGDDFLILSASMLITCCFLCVLLGTLMNGGLL